MNGGAGSWSDFPGEFSSAFPTAVRQQTLQQGQSLSDDEAQSLWAGQPLQPEWRAPPTGEGGHVGPCNQPLKRGEQLGQYDPLQGQGEQPFQGHQPRDEHRLYFGCELQRYQQKQEDEEELSASSLCSSPDRMVIGVSAAAPMALAAPLVNPKVKPKPKSTKSKKKPTSKVTPSPTTQFLLKSSSSSSSSSLLKSSSSVSSLNSSDSRLKGDPPKRYRYHYAFTSRPEEEDDQNDLEVSLEPSANQDASPPSSCASSASRGGSDGGMRRKKTRRSKARLTKERTGNGTELLVFTFFLVVMMLTLSQVLVVHHKYNGHYTTGSGVSGGGGPPGSRNARIRAQQELRMVDRSIAALRRRHPPSPKQAAEDLQKNVYEKRIARLILKASQESMDLLHYQTLLGQAQANVSNSPLQSPSLYSMLSSAFVSSQSKSNNGSLTSSLTSDDSRASSPGSSSSSDSSVSGPSSSESTTSPSSSMPSSQSSKTGGSDFMFAALHPENSSRWNFSYLPGDIHSLPSRSDSPKTGVRGNGHMASSSEPLPQARASRPPARTDYPRNVSETMLFNNLTRDEGGYEGGGAASAVGEMLLDTEAGDAGGRDIDDHEQAAGGESAFNWTIADKGPRGGNFTAIEVPSRRLCNDQPPILFGNVSGDVNREHKTLTLAQVQAWHKDLAPGGEWSPPGCVARYRLAVVIPYRDRLAHLTVLLAHLIPILKRQQLHFRIFVVEQSGNLTFNKGRIMNAAFKEALKLYDFQCVAFHDVDLIPEDDRNMYSCPIMPRHMSVAVDEMNYTLSYTMLVGGVLNMRVEHFQQVNGYSNMYWGWGAEDDDMAYRILHVGLKIFRPPSRIARYQMIKHVKRKPTSWSIRGRLLRTAVKRYHLDGLNSVQYNIKFIHNDPLYTHIMVDVGKPDMLIDQR